MDPYHLCCELLRVLAEKHPELVRPQAKILSLINPRRHGPGFTSVVWDGTLYSFTSAQAAVVAVLWRANRQGCPEVKTERLMEAAGSAGRRIDNVFRAHGVVNPAWGKVIVPGEAKGTFRLAG